MPKLSLADWDRRFNIQGAWSQNLRRKCQHAFPLPPFSRVLEVGSGTGAIISTLSEVPGGLSIALDIEYTRLSYSSRLHPSLHHTQGDAAKLPFENQVFDQSLCHYLLLWLDDPVNAVGEMRRVTKPGGMVFLFSEPDYGGRIDHPQELGILKEKQIEGLREQGADPLIGRKLRWILQASGLREIHTGVLEWSDQTTIRQEDFDSEWSMLENDLRGRISSKEFHRLREIDRGASVSQTRCFFLPIFYGWGVA